MEQSAAAAADGPFDAGEVGAATLVRRHDLAVDYRRGTAEPAAASTSGA